MRTFLFANLCLAFLITASIVESAACNADNCLRAVTGTAKGAARVTAARNDCSSFLLNPATRSVPAYASVCSGAARYSSACSCWVNALTASSPIASSTKGVVTTPPVTAATSTPTTISTSVIATQPTTTTATTSTTTTTSTSSSSTVLDGSTATGTYSPAVPSSYLDCAVDPIDPASVVNLLDPQTGIPIMNNIGQAGLPTAFSDDYPGYHFIHPIGAPDNFYDLVTIDGLYLAVYSTGEVRFTSSSSNGPSYVLDNQGRKYVTTIWTPLCTGELSAGIPNGPAIQFSIIDNNLTASFTSSPTKRRSLQKRQAQFGPLYALRKSPPFLPTPTTNPLADPSRCPNPLQTAVPKTPPVPITKNGCGTKTGIGALVPELWFHACCNGHDECYGTCSQSFQGCNSAFLTCNLQTCGSVYPGTTVKARLQRQGCEFFARLYGAAVKSAIGQTSYKNATPQYCNCVCRSGGFADCGEDACVDYRSDPRHCGACNSNCGDAICLNGECFVDPCPGPYCDNSTMFSTPLPTAAPSAPIVA